MPVDIRTSADQKKNVPHVFSGEDVREVNTTKLEIILISSFLGPPIGTLILLAAVSAYGLFLNMGAIVFNLAHFLGGIGAVAFFILYGSIVSYLYGSTQAIASGVLLSILSGRFSGVTYELTALVVGVVSIVAGLVLVGFMNFPVWIAGTLGGIGIAASLILRFLFRRRFSTRAV